MAFTSEIKGSILMNPCYKTLPEQQQTKLLWGTFTNTSGSTGGEIDLGADQVVMAMAVPSTGANAVQIVLDSGSAGKITITTTADDDGRFMALVQKRKW